MFKKIKAFIHKHFKKEQLQYKVNDKILCILIADNEEYLIKAEIWEVNKNGYLVTDLNNILDNNPFKLWFIKFDDVIELTH
jgi:hypothetical protein